MARISTYQTDTDVIGSDKVIGTDFSGNVTKNYTLTGIGKYLAKAGRNAVNRQTSFFFQSDLSGGRKFGSMSLQLGGTASLSGTATLILSKKTFDGRDHDLVVGYSDQNFAFIFSTEAPNTFARYRVTSVVDYPADAAYLIITLQFIEGQGSFVDGDVFGFATIYDNGDRHYTHNQTTASSTWIINHDLGKNPSVSVVDSANTVVIGDVDYINSNSLQIQFKGAFKGKAYLN